MFDFERGAKTTGSKFLFTTGEDALLEWNLIGQMISYHVKNGFTFVIPPYLVRRETAEVAGILPRFEGDFYETTDKLLLIPTAETAMVGMHMHETFAEDALPIKYVAFSPCFRREAGAGGTRDKGLRRVHQFHKVELFVICKPEASATEHMMLVSHVQAMLHSFFPELKHRVVKLTDADRSPVSAETFDIEIMHDAEWLEVSSISNTLDRQSKPGQIRYKPKIVPKKGRKTIDCHMLNGSGIALPRLLLALTEKY